MGNKHSHSVHGGLYDPRFHEQPMRRYNSQGHLTHLPPNAAPYPPYAVAEYFDSNGYLQSPPGYVDPVENDPFVMRDGPPSSRQSSGNPKSPHGTVDSGYWSGRVHESERTTKHNSNKNSMHNGSNMRLNEAFMPPHPHGLVPVELIPYGPIPPHIPGPMPPHPLFFMPPHQGPDGFCHPVFTPHPQSLSPRPIISPKQNKKQKKWGRKNWKQKHQNGVLARSESASGIYGIPDGYPSHGIPRTVSMDGVNNLLYHSVDGSFDAQAHTVPLNQAGRKPISQLHRRNSDKIEVISHQSPLKKPQDKKEASPQTDIMSARPRRYLGPMNSHTGSDSRSAGSRGLKENGVPNGTGNWQRADEESIYETLKGQKVGPFRMTTQADISADAEMPVVNERERETVAEPVANPPQVVSEEAKIVMARNAAVLGCKPDDEHHNNHKKFEGNHVIPKANQMTTTVANMKQSQEIPQQQDVAEEHIKMEVNPVLPIKNIKKDPGFEPFDIWRRIDVAAHILKLPAARDTQDQAGESKIMPRFYPVPPARHDHCEPIYLEYDGRLPDFKKRLIETGSFDYPEKQEVTHQSQPESQRSANRRQDGSLQEQHEKSSFNFSSGKRNWKSFVMPDSASNSYSPAATESKMARRFSSVDDVAGKASEEGGQATDGKGSLRHLRQSISNIFHKQKSQEKLSELHEPITAHHVPPPTNERRVETEIVNRQPAELAPVDPMVEKWLNQSAEHKGGYQSSGCQTPTARNGFVSESDIDFSWVHDLEAKFRKERGQFEKDLESIKMKHSISSISQTPPKLSVHEVFAPLRLEQQQINQPIKTSEVIKAATVEIRPVQQNKEQYMRKDLRHNMDYDRPASPYNGSEAGTRIQIGNYTPFTQQNHVPRLHRFNDHDLHITHSPPNNPNSGRDNNVRLKARMFETQAERVNKEMSVRDEQIARQKRSRSAPSHTVLDDECGSLPTGYQRMESTNPMPYIPTPDYNDSGHAHQERRGLQRYSNSPHSGANFGKTPNGDHHSEDNVIPYNGGPTDVQVLQAGRRYDATEFYRQNYQPKRDMQACQINIVSNERKFMHSPEPRQFRAVQFRPTIPQQ